jgi:ornithine cyclodeaminase/alanine dehydrogenase-like protein (mu-crystallin family)
MITISEASVRELVSYPACIAAIRDAHRALARGDAILPVRMTLGIPELGEMNVMPGSLGHGRGLGTKIVTFSPHNDEVGLPAVHAVVLLLDPETGVPLATIEAAHLTAMRTAAASAIATDALASQEATVLALLGAGVQAESHLEAMLEIRAIESVRVSSQHPDTARQFVERLQPRFPALGMLAVDSAHEAVRDADVICTVTTATTPVIQFDWLKPGCHVNAVGAHSPEFREIDSETMTRARVIVDARESALSECGDCLIPIAEGRFTEEHVSDELGEVLVGRKPGRESDTQITVFQSCGLAIQDVAAARVALDAAQHTSLGAR